MKNSRDSPTTPDHLQAALEASNGALMGLEWILAQLTDEAEDRANVRQQTRQAMDSVRQAIAELRLARGESAGVLTLGFVIKADSKWFRGASRRRRYPIPRRTA
jgi:hypothetical protein